MQALFLFASDALNIVTKTILEQDLFLSLKVSMIIAEGKEVVIFVFRNSYLKNDRRQFLGQV